MKTNAYEFSNTFNIRVKQSIYSKHCVRLALQNSLADVSNPSHDNHNIKKMT